MPLFKVLVIFILFIRNGTCLAVGEPVQFSKVLSRKKGGISKTFFFDNSSIQNDGIFEETKVVNRDRSSGRTIDRVRNIKAGFSSVFLPIGYPDSSPPGYLRYASWSWIQDLSTQLRGVLATQRVLEGVGVGRAGATSLSAILNFLVRDGCGMAANLIFTAFASPSFSADAKRWRIFADTMVDIGITLEIMATLVPTPLFLPMISVGNMCKAICGVAAGATGGVFNLYWAKGKGSGIADIQAKFGAQHTVTGALGLISAALFARSVADFSGFRLWFLYFSLLALHLYANMQCMKLIAMESINTSRMRLLIRQFTRELKDWKDASTDNESETSPSIKLLDPITMARREPLFFIGPGSRLPCRILFGESFEKHQCISGLTSEELKSSVSLQEPYLISWNPRKKKVVVSLSNNATNRDKVKAYFHAYLIGDLMRHSPKKENISKEEIEFSYYWLEFQACLENAGWDLDQAELHGRGYEYSLVTNSAQ